MRHESISVIYDSSMAIADEIAEKLGAQALSVQSLTQRSIESCHSFVLGIVSTNHLDEWIGTISPNI